MFRCCRRAPRQPEDKSEAGGPSLEATGPPQGDSSDFLQSLYTDRNLQLTDRAEKQARELFQRYRCSIEERTQASTPSGGVSRRNGRMTADQLRKVLKKVDEDLFSYIFRLFSPDEDGTIDADHFVGAFALLTSMSDAAADRQVEACFFMFDVDCTGTLSRTEFTTMVQATVPAPVLSHAPPFPLPPSLQPVHIFDSLALLAPYRPPLDDGTHAAARNAKLPNMR